MDSRTALPVVKDVRQHLSGAGIYPTSQRRALARILFDRHQHLTADQVYEKARRKNIKVSRATVYNTLNLFVEKGLLREIFVNASHTFYDSNIHPHFHFYNVDDGSLTDMEGHVTDDLVMQNLPQGTVLDGVDVVVRVRNNA
ncbi:Fur family transcriptional regulator [Thiolapillus sp.]